MSQCYGEGEHVGEVFEYTSRSGATTSFRCERHQDQYNERMDKVERDLQERYPGYDNENSTPPAWFDPTYAGETW